MNIPIYTGVSGFTLDSRKVVILEFGEGLWFGNRMEKSLIKPNQCQNRGMQICNDQTDPQRKLGIEASEDLFTPMAM